MTLTNLRAKVRFLLGEITSSSYSDTNLDRALNDYYHKAISIALEESGEWEIQGEIATANLVASQQEYTLPTDILTLKRVEANFPDGTRTWTKLPILDMRNIDTPLSNKTTDSDSIYCRIYDNSIFLEYPVDDAVTAGLKIYYSVEISELSSGSDTPDMPEHCGNYLIHGACIDYCLRVSNDDDYKKYKQLLLEDEIIIRKHYSNRLTAIRPRITAHKENYE